MKINVTINVDDFFNQDFEFNDHYCHNKELISTVVKSKYKIIKRLQRFSCTHFLTVHNENKAVLGLAFYSKKDIIYVLGFKEYFDYSDAFFSNEDYKTIKEAFLAMIDFLSKKYNKIMWNYLPQDSMIKLILDEYNVIPIKYVENVSIDYTGLSYDEYFKSLSKSNKQNLRTAVNRITRENGTIQLITNFDHNLDYYVFKDATSLYVTRQKNKYEKNHYFLRKINFKYFNFMINLMKKIKEYFLDYILMVNCQLLCLDWLIKNHYLLKLTN